ncbi:MAG: radical SAM protein [Lachnospiraceae bacterium]|nr:radical SAM protein [Lachnospiraceae bacterium]
MNRYKNDYCKELAQRIFLEDLEDCYYFPKYITIETCNNCNARCIMCPKGQKSTNSVQLMDETLFKKIVEEVQGYSNWIEMICLNSDGEPLLDKDIAHKIFRLKHIGIKHVQISTNAQLLSREKIRELLDSGLDDIRISLDGYSKQVYEKIRQGLDYDIVKENTLNLIQMRNKAKSSMTIRMRMVELEENIGEREEWMRYWKSQVNENDKVQLMPMHTWSGTVVDEKKERIEYYSDKPCVSVYSSFAINYNGIVQLCDSDVEQKEIVGDIREKSIQEIWQGERFEMIRDWHAHANRNNIEICQGCDHWSREFKEIVN